MKEITVNQAAKLIKSVPTPAVSIYLGTNIIERDASTRMKNNLHGLYRTAEALVTKTYDRQTRARLLEPLKNALTALRLNRSKGGLAIYHSEHFTGVVKIPTAVSDLVVAADSFHLKPVLRCLQMRRSYYLLAFRKNYAELILVTADAAKVIERISYGIKDHSGALDTDERKDSIKEITKIRRRHEISETMATLNRQLESYWQKERVPLLLAGPHHLLESFRDQSTYGNLLERTLTGSIDHVDLNALTRLSSGIMEHIFSRLDSNEVLAFQKAQSSGLASTDINHIAMAAVRGQVRNLLIAEDRHIWGYLDRINGRVEILSEQIDATSDDLLDDIAELTLLKGGKVTVLPSIEMPGKQPIAAVLRWDDSPRQVQKKDVPTYPRKQRETHVYMTA
jgi:hypothetical protein